MIVSASVQKYELVVAAAELDKWKFKNCKLKMGELSKGS